MPPTSAAGGWQPPPQVGPGRYQPTPPPAPGRRSVAGPLVAVAIVLALAAIAALVVVRSDDGEVDAEERVAASTTTAPTTTTTAPRVTESGLLFGYCDTPGAAWPEVPPHVAGEPVRTQVRILGRDPGNGLDRPAGSTGPVAGADGGSTVLSPVTDGTFTSDPAVLVRTRAVTCVSFIESVATGEICQYEALYGSSLERSDYELARSRWKVTVYELHSGGVLHQGEIETSTDHCPDQIAPDPGDTQVAFTLTDQDVLGWIGSHFSGGTPV